MPASTLIQLRHALGAALDDLGVFGVTAASQNTVSATGFADQQTGAPTTTYDDRWVYHPATIQLRRVARGGTNPSLGRLTLGLGWGPIPAPGTYVELTGMFPGVEQVGPEDTSYRTIWNRALGYLAIPDRVTVPITTAASYPLPFPWLDRPDRLVRVLEPGPVAWARPVPCDWRGVRVAHQAGGLTLEVDAPFPVGGGVLTLEVLRPAWTLVNGAESTTGLVNDGDTVAISVEDALPTALAVAYQILGHRAPGRPNGPWRDLAEKQREIARGTRYYDRGLDALGQQQQPAAPAPVRAEAAA